MHFHLWDIWRSPQDVNDGYMEEVCHVCHLGVCRYLQIVYSECCKKVTLCIWQSPSSKLCEVHVVQSRPYLPIVNPSLPSPEVLGLAKGLR